MDCASQDRSRNRLCWSLASGLVMLGSVAILFFFNPSQYGFYPRCLFNKVTGLSCPGCGGLRATHQLLHGHLREAFDFNPLLIVSLPFLGLWTVFQLVQALTGKRLFKFSLSRHWVWVLLGVLIVFTILRNIAVFSRT